MNDDYTIEVPTSPYVQWNTESIIVKGGLMRDAPDALQARIGNDISQEEVNENTINVIKRLHKSNNINKGDRRYLREMFSPPLKFNPNVMLNNRGFSNLAGHTLLGRLLTDKATRHLVHDFLETGFDCAHYPDEPFILAAAQFQTTEEMQAVHNAGANIFYERQSGENAIYCSIDGPRYEKYTKIAWLLDRGVDGYSANLTNPSGQEKPKVSPFKYVTTWKAPSEIFLRFMLDRGMGRIVPCVTGNEKNIYFVHQEHEELELVHPSRKQALLDYIKDVDTLCNDLIKSSKKLAHMTRQDAIKAYAVHRMDVFDTAHWQDNIDAFTALFDQLPPPVQTAIREHGLDPLLTAHHAKTAIEGPAKDWSAMETSAPESEVRR